MNTIRIEYQSNYAVLRLSNGKANTINAEMANEILDALLELKTNEQVKGVILTGHGEFFSAGLDVIELYKYNENQMSDFWKLFSRLARRLVAFPKPLIAAITGHSPAGGCVLALGCDYRVMATGNYRIGLNEIPFGIVVPNTIYNLYGFTVGKGNAYKFLLEGKLHTPEEALKCGLVDEITSLEEVEQKAIQQLQVYLKLNTKVWTQSKMNFRNDLLNELNADFESTFEPTLKQWWTPENRALLEHIISSLKKKS
jgi:Delta3-Delta2-enoyl-CoA isomerase